jgi:hypothetical protein
LAPKYTAGYSPDWRSPSPSTQLFTREGNGLKYTTPVHLTAAILQQWENEEKKICN